MISDNVDLRNIEKDMLVLYCITVNNDDLVYEKSLKDLQQ